MSSGGGRLTSGSEGGGGVLVEESDSGGIRIRFDAWRALLAAAPLPVRVFLVGLATLSATSAMALLAFAQNPVGFIRDIITELIFRDLLLPAFFGLVGIGVGLLNALITVGVGTDGQVGIAPGSFPGLADIPFLFSGPLAAAVQGAAVAAIGAIQSINAGVGAELAVLGIAAPTVVAFIWAIEAAGALYVLYIGFQTIDFLSLGLLGQAVDIGRAAARPIIRLVGAFR